MSAAWRSAAGRCLRADAAARIDVAHDRETGEIRFLPDVYTTAHNYASMNPVFFQRRPIGVAATGISMKPARARPT